MLFKCFRSRRSWAKLLIMAIACLFVGQVSVAQQRDRGKASARKSSPGMTKAREAAALAFVREHHAELEQLLIRLKESQPRQYERAVQDLFRTSERLTAISEKDPQRHELELKAWQLKSRVQLLSATMLMSPGDKKVRDKLKQALLDEAAVRREVLTLDRERLTRRLKKVESQIDNIEQNADRMVERQIKSLLEGPPKPATTKRVD